MAESDRSLAPLPALVACMGDVAALQAALRRRYGLAVVVDVDAARTRVTVHIGDPADPTMPLERPRGWLAG